MHKLASNLGFASTTTTKSILLHLHASCTPSSRIKIMISLAFQTAFAVSPRNLFRPSCVRRLFCPGSSNVSCVFPLDSCSQCYFSSETTLHAHGSRHAVAQAAPRQSVVPEADFALPTPIHSSNIKKKTAKKLLEESDKRICPGCGVPLQDTNPNVPGYFKRPAWMEETESKLEDEEGSEEELADEEEGEDKQDFPVFENLEEEEDDIKEAHAKAERGLDWKFVPSTGELEEWKRRLEDTGRAFNGFTERKHSNKREEGGFKKEALKEEAERVVVCARCHSLRYYGKVKDEHVENLLPDFDFDRTVGARLMRTSSARAVVLMVVDASDFDGSFPRRAAALLSQVEEQERQSWQKQKPGNIPRLVMVVNKVDLLPGEISQARLDHWVRRRSKAGGATRLSGLFLVSALRGWGVQAVVKTITELAGPRGEIWVIGAQNAGKSSLINALGRLGGGKKVTHLTEAPIPGTTLGIVRVDGVLPAKAKLFDTPGLLHPHQITVRLNREEQKMVYVRKELKPRTYRAKVNDTIHVGGLARIDVKEAPASSIYISVWMSAHLPCHMGTTEKADENFQKHVGNKLQPPMDKERLEELGSWTRTPVRVEGDSWDRSSVDVAVAGLGWFGLCLKGPAMLDVWTYEGVAITIRDALVHDMASIFEKPGFTVVKGGTIKEKSGKNIIESKETVDARPLKKQVAQDI